MKLFTEYRESPGAFLMDQLAFPMGIFVSDSLRSAKSIGGRNEKSQTWTNVPFFSREHLPVRTVKSVRLLGRWPKHRCPATELNL
jgi:hypothetical protein